MSIQTYICIAILSLLAGMTPTPWAAAQSVPQAAAPSACGPNPGCTEVSSFAATLTDFRPSVSGRYRVVDATIRFQNKTDRPLILGYVRGSGTVVDDKGNRYAANDGVLRGIGLINGNTFDSKFTLRPGEASDARIEFAWSPTGGAIIGTSFDPLDFAVREIDPVGANQYRLGREHALTIRHPGSLAAPPVPVSSVALPPPPRPAANLPQPPPVDACGGRPRCYSAGPLMATVTQLTAIQSATSRANRTISLNVDFRNLGNQPVTLAYSARTSTAVDNQGNKFFDGGVTGIGTADGRSVNTQFVLAPGQSRSAKFNLWRRQDRTILGTSWTWDVTIAEVHVLANGQQVETVRENSMHFPDIR